MSDKQEAMLKRLGDVLAENTQDRLQYWLEFSNAGTWQFWFNVFIIVAPLILLAFALERRQAFRISFYGLLVHMVFTYIDAFGTLHGFWEYPYKFFPFLTVSIGLDSSLVPVVYMLLYQWVLNRKKNYYLWFFLLSLAFAFGLKPIMTALDLFQFYRGANFLHLFAGYYFIALTSKWITDLFARHQGAAEPAA